MFVAGVDGCRAGWIAFKVELAPLVTSVTMIDLPAWLRDRTRLPRHRHPPRAAQWPESMRQGSTEPATAALVGGENDCSK
jgi:hypothetical protein